MTNNYTPSQKRFTGTFSAFNDSLHKVNSRKAILSFLSIVILVSIFVTGLIALVMMKLKINSLESQLQDPPTPLPYLSQPTITPLPTNSPESSKSDQEIKDGLRSEFLTQFIGQSPRLKSEIGGKQIRDISKFTLTKTAETGWVIGIGSKEDKNYLDRYLAYRDNLTLLSTTAIECGFGIEATKPINQTPQYSDDLNFHQTQETNRILFSHGGCGGPVHQSLIDLDNRGLVTFSDPNNLSISHSISPDGYSIVGGKYESTEWNNLLVVKLGGQPLDIGVAVFDINTGILLDIIEYNNYPQTKKHQI